MTSTLYPVSQNYIFTKTRKYYKEHKELLEPTLDQISPFFTKMSKNKTWAKDSQYDSL